MENNNISSNGGILNKNVMEFFEKVFIKSDIHNENISEEDRKILDKGKENLKKIENTFYPIPKVNGKNGKNDRKR